MSKYVLLILLLLPLSACQTTAQYMANMQYQSPLQVCTEASFEPDVFGYGKAKIDAARATIQKRNIQCDWEAVALERQRRDIAFQNGLNALTGMYNSMVAQETAINNSIMQNNRVYGGYNSGVQNDGSIKVQGAGYLKRSIMDGQQRICYYEKLGKTSFVRIPSTQICPQIN